MQATHPASEASSGSILFGSKVTSVMPTLPPGLRITTLPTGQMLLVYSRNTSSRSTFCWRGGAVELGRTCRDRAGPPAGRRPGNEQVGTGQADDIRPADRPAPARESQVGNGHQPAGGDPQPASTTAGGEERAMQEGDLGGGA